MTNKQRFPTEASIGTRKTIRQRTASRRKHNDYVWGTAAWRALWGFIGGASFAAFAFRTGVVVGWLEMTWMDWWLMSVAWGGFCGGLAGFINVERLRSAWESFNIVEDYDEEPVMAAGAQHERPFTVNGVPTYRRADVILRHDGRSWTWKGPELDIMLGWYNKGIAKFRRDHDPNAGRPGVMAFNRITTADYTTIREIMMGLGIIDERNYWTQQGGDWLKTAGLPEDD